MRQYQVKKDSTGPVRVNIRFWIMTLIALGLALYFLHSCISPQGYFAVKELCEKEGGLRILKAVNVQGYWNLGDHGKGLENYDCELCKEQLTQGDFEYVDYQRPSKMLDGRPTFVRFKLLGAGDSQCTIAPAGLKVPVGRCIGAVPLEGPPSNEYRFRADVRKFIGPFGAKVGEIGRTVYDVDGKSVIATFNYFSHRTPSEASGHFAPSYSCEGSAAINEFDDGAFIRKTLRVQHSSQTS